MMTGTQAAVSLSRRSHRQRQGGLLAGQVPPPTSSDSARWAPGCARALALRRGSTSVAIGISSGGPVRRDADQHHAGERVSGPSRRADGPHILLAWRAKFDQAHRRLPVTAATAATTTQNPTVTTRNQVKKSCPFRTAGPRTNVLAAKLACINHATSRLSVRSANKLDPGLSELVPRLDTA